LNSSSLNIIRGIKTKISVVQHTSQMKNVYKILLQKPEWKRPLGRPWNRWENNIKMDLKETGCGMYSTG